MQHLKSNDARHSFHSGSLTLYKCPKCGREDANPIFLRCPADDTMMVPSGRIGEQKVDEIRNRVVEDVPDELKPAPKGVDLWDEDLIKKNVKAKIKPISGKGEIVIRGRMNKNAYIEKIVKINGGWYRLSDIALALTEVM